MSESPRCFISYSWEGDEHSVWVRKLATRLRECGIDAILDQFHCAPGMDLTRFMERSIRESAFVLLVCTPTFARKADAGVGGVGYEKMIVTGEIFAGEERETKFVPLLRQGDAKEALPSYLKSRLFVDFREDASFERKLEDLLRHFYGEPLYSPPPVGPRPTFEPRPVAPAPAEVVGPREFTNNLGMRFVLLPSGTLVMGSPRDEEGRSDDEKQHEVIIGKPFHLQTTQVTQGQWKRIMKDNPSDFKKCGDDCSVENVSWQDAQAFISKLNEVEGGKQYRLPTEAEWEYACRAESTTRFCFGDDEAELGEYAWYRANSKRTTHPVGEKEPNAWGLYDMHGNVWEWCQDWYGAYPEGRVGDPRGRTSGESRVVRGGSWFNGAEYIRSANRGKCRPDYRDYNIGFRLARDS